MLHPRMGGHCVVTRNGPADLSTEKVQNRAACRVFDDELEQLHGGLRQAAGGFDKEDGKMLRVFGKIPENGKRKRQNDSFILGRSILGNVHMAL